MRWKDGILIAIISGVVGLLLRGYLSLGHLELPLINGIWLVLSFFVGLMGGSDILAILYDLYRKHEEKKQQEIQKHNDGLMQEKIYNWIYTETEKYKDKINGLVGGYIPNKLNDPRFRSTEEIAGALNMYPLEKVKSLCYANKKLTKMIRSDLIRENTPILYEEQLEKWAIKEFVR